MKRIYCKWPALGYLVNPVNPVELLFSQSLIIQTNQALAYTEELVWDKSTDNEPCEQYFKVVFADGEESDAVKFDFCEKGLVLEFNSRLVFFGLRQEPLPTR